MIQERERERERDKRDLPMYTTNLIIDTMHEIDGMFEISSIYIIILLHVVVSRQTNQTEERKTMNNI